MSLSPPSLHHWFRAIALSVALASCGNSDSPSGPDKPAPDPDAGRAELTALAPSVGELSPPFSPGIRSYTVTVEHSEARISFTPSADVGNPSIRLEGPGLEEEGVPVAPGAPSPSVLLTEGDNVIRLVAVSADGENSATYELTVTRTAAPPNTRACPTVNRGDPADGLTTITVLQPPAPCTAGPPWDGWYCTVLQSAANNNGVLYAVEARWNRVGLPVRGSFTWVTDFDSASHWREGDNLSADVQDQLDAVDQVRTIDLAWGGAGTTTPPRNGYVNLSAVYADVVEHLVAAGIAEGVLGQFSNSGGSTMAGSALVNHRLHEVWDGVVFGGGPFWNDLAFLCGSGTSQGTRVLIDDWTWTEVDGSTPCARGSGAEPSFACMSLIGPDSVFDFPNTIVAILTGDTDSAFITTEASVFFRAITARSKTRDYPIAPHNILRTQSGATLVLQRIRGIVDAGPSR